jgi:hypothetical protein
MEVEDNYPHDGVLRELKRPHSIMDLFESCKRGQSKIVFFLY